MAKTRNQDPELIAELSAIETDLKTLHGAGKALLKRVNALSKRLAKAAAADEAKAEKAYYNPGATRLSSVATYEYVLHAFGSPNEDNSTGFDVRGNLTEVVGLIADAIGFTRVARAELPDETQRVTPLLAAVAKAKAKAKARAKA